MLVKMPKSNTVRSALTIDEQLVLVLNTVSAQASQSTLTVYTKYLSGHVSDLFLSYRHRPDAPALADVHLAINKAWAQTKGVAGHHLVYPYCSACKFGIFNQEDLFCKSCWREK